MRRLYGLGYLVRRFMKVILVLLAILVLWIWLGPTVRQYGLVGTARTGTCWAFGAGCIDFDTTPPNFTRFRVGSTPVGKDHVSISMTRNEGLNLSYCVENADDVFLNGERISTKCSTKPLTPDVTTAYILVASNEAGDPERKFTINVQNAGNQQPKDPDPTPAPTGTPPAPVATATPTTPSAPPSGGGSGTQANRNSQCPDTATAQQAIGLSVVRLATEYCAWTWRSYPDVKSANLPEGYIGTLHLEDNDRIVVTNRPGRYQIKAATFRFVGGYPSNDAVHRPCELLKKEQDNGAREVPSFPVHAMNLDCGTDQNSAAAPATSPNALPQQPTLTVEEVAAWCHPTCRRALEQLKESNGKINPAGVKLKPNIDCYVVNIPANVSYDIWNGSTGRSGQEATRLDRVCEGSFRKNPA